MACSEGLKYDRGTGIGALLYKRYRTTLHFIEEHIDRYIGNKVQRVLLSYKKVSK